MPKLFLPVSISLITCFLSSMENNSKQFANIKKQEYIQMSAEEWQKLDALLASLPRLVPHPSGRGVEWSNNIRPAEAEEKETNQ